MGIDLVGDTVYNNLTAEIARKRSIEVSSAGAKEQLRAVLTTILEETDKGNTSTYFYQSLLPNVNNELQKRGFKIKNTSDQKDGISFFIEW